MQEMHKNLSYITPSASFLEDCMHAIAASPLLRDRGAGPGSRKSKMKPSAYILALSQLLGATLIAETPIASRGSWPHPVPCRIQDGTNQDLFVMTLGDVATTIADGVCDPVKDEVTLNDGTVKANYYRDVLDVKQYQPLDKSRFSLPPSGWCTWYQEPLPDNPKRVALTWGPLVLAGDLGPEEGRGRGRRDSTPDAVPVFVASGQPISTWLKPVPGKLGDFDTQEVGHEKDVDLVPFYELSDGLCGHLLQR